jgi:hypothetical protein
VGKRSYVLRRLLSERGRRTGLKVNWRIVAVVVVVGLFVGFGSGLVENAFTPRRFSPSTMAMLTLSSA